MEGSKANQRHLAGSSSNKAAVHVLSLLSFMMKVEESLKSLGWHLSPEWISENLVSDGRGDNNVDKTLKILLNEDIRRIGYSFINDEIVKEKSEWTFKSNCVFQVHKVTNVAAPKANEECNVAPRLLLVHITDGSQTLATLDLNSIPSLNLNTAPGTKLKIRAGKLSCLGGYLVLQKSSVDVLGGSVEALFEKWQISRSLAKYNRSNWASSGIGGPPPWVPFGQKIASVEPDGKFKSFGGNVKEKENDDFEQQRKANIDEITRTKLGCRKIFGGGRSSMSDSRVDVENHYVKDKNKEMRGEWPTRSRGRGQERRGRRGGGRGVSEKTDDVITSAPSKPHTLFDFLESKMSDMTLKSAKNEKAVFETTHPYKSQTSSFPNSHHSSSTSQSGSYAYSTQRVSQSARSHRPSQSIYQVPVKSPSISSVEAAQTTVRLETTSSNSRQQNPRSTMPVEEQPKANVNWRSGDRCLAQYWEDNKFYPATIHAVAPNRATCVVCFSQFGNYEEVLLEHVKHQPDRGENHFSRPGRGRSTTFYRSKQVN
ncbi:tudor domain-containing protein 3 [Chamberlinius hualienensis]